MMRSTYSRRATTVPSDSPPAGFKPKSAERRLTTLDDDVNVSSPKVSTAPKLVLKDEEVQAFRHLAHTLVSRTLAHECEFRQLGCPEPNSNEWKFLKRQDDLSVYKRLQPEESETDETSKTYTVKCIGTLGSTLEDILYGTHSKNRTEMRATAAYLHKNHMDCAVLNVLDKGSDEDPYHQVALKWFITETFGDARLVNHRDWFNVESTGMNVDAWGRRYGFFLAKFADHPGCPPMPEDSDVIRGKMYMCCIYRQQPRSKCVDVYAEGSIDLGGGMPAFITTSASCAMMFSMATAVDSAEGKRLTQLALQRAKQKGIERREKNGSEVGAHLERTQKDTTDSEIDLAASVISLSTTCCDEMKPRKAPRELCHVCEKKPAMFNLIRSSHRKCGICHERTCSKCCVKRALFGQSGRVTFVCCKFCILESKRLSIDPRDPCPILP